MPCLHYSNHVLALL
jgi:hypothetical protein